MLNNMELRAFIIRPSLNAIQLYSPGAEEMLVAICAHESLGGSYICQISKGGKIGPAKGIYQIEDATYNDIWSFIEKEHPDIIKKFQNFCPYANHHSPDFQINDLNYATIMARLFFLRIKTPFPVASDINAIAAFWKLHFNTILGAGKVEDFIRNYHNFIGR